MDFQHALHAGAVVHVEHGQLGLRRPIVLHTHLPGASSPRAYGKLGRIWLFHAFPLKLFLHICFL